MNHDYEKTLELVENIDKLLQEHLAQAIMEDEQEWTHNNPKQKVTPTALKAKREFLLKAKMEHLKVIKFSLDQLTEKHKGNIEKESYLKVFM